MILSIETSTTACSVALHKDEKLLVCLDLLLDQSHSGMLTLLIDYALKAVSATYKDLTAIALSQGPGSYTGLRIGSATAKGLCMALDLPLLAVSTLQAMAKNVADFMPDNTILLCPMLDARRMEVYTALYDKNLQVVQNINALVVDNQCFVEEVSKQKIVYFGNGAAKCKPFLEHENFIFIPNIIPSARYIGGLATMEQVVDVAYFEPLYLKEYQAPK